MLKQNNNQVKNKKMNIAIVGTGLVGRVLALNLLLKYQLINLAF